MKQGDFTAFAKDYINRSGYSLDVLRMIGRAAGKDRRDFKVADVGAGTGKLTENLSQLGLTGCAVEPNDAMRAEGIKVFEANPSFTCYKGSAENTGMPENSFDWVLMGSSFHWTNAEEALKAFHRILKPGAYFTAIWNPRNIEGNELHESIEKMISDVVPELKRVSSGSKKNIGDIEGKMLSTKYFSNLIFVEASYNVVMTKERYIGAWRSVNDIQAQAGPERFEKIIKNIEEIIAPYPDVVVPYKSRAWTVQSV